MTSISNRFVRCRPTACAAASGELPGEVMKQLDDALRLHLAL